MEKHCPDGYQWKDGGLLARSVNEFEKVTNADLVCYAKINFDENKRRQTKFIIKEARFYSNNVIEFSFNRILIFIMYLMKA